MSKSWDESLKYEHPLRPQFIDWFSELLYKCKSCQERDVLRDCKENLFLSYIKEFEVEPEVPND